MRRFLPVLFILFSLLACRVDVAIHDPTPTQLPSPTVTATQLPPTFTPTVSPSPWPTTTPTATLTPVPPSPGFILETHPDGPLYVGDLVSLSVIAPSAVNLDGASLSITIDGLPAVTFPSVVFDQWGIAARWQATLVWGWDTVGVAAGDYALDFSVDPQGYHFTETITLLPDAAKPPALAGAEWASAITECCVLSYITGTAVERDLPALLVMVDQQAEHAIQVMGIDFTDPIPITIMPRVLGHGGFASDEIYVSYLDRNYVSNSWEMVVHHEMIHILDRRLGGDLRPSILVEGLAVYQSGGHYRPEALLPRAAALLPEYLNLFIPLATLADDFYTAQHEIGYLEAGALVQYLVEAYGWDAFSTFYRDIHPVESAGQAAALDAALLAHFDQTLAQMEEAFVLFLRGQTDVEEWLPDVALTVSYFDTLRRYQSLLDPSAYFRTAWLMDGPSMRQRGIVGDYLRHPTQPENLALETMFIAASDRWVSQDFAGADLLIDSTNCVLGAIELGQSDPFSAHPLAADYLAIALALIQNGYEVQSIELSGDTAETLVTAQSVDLLELQLFRDSGIWRIH